MYSREKLDLLAVTLCLRNGSGTAIYNQNFRFSPASVSGKEDHATGNTQTTSQRSSMCMVRMVAVACLWMLYLEKQLF